MDKAKARGDGLRESGPGPTSFPLNVRSLAAWFGALPLVVNNGQSRLTSAKHLLFGQDSLSKWEDPWMKTGKVPQAFVGSFYELNPVYKMKQKTAVSHSQGSRERAGSRVMSGDLAQN